MTLIDSQGRILGRINLFDAVVAAFVLVLVPLAYATALLFRTPTPTIASVRRVDVTREEIRVAGPGIVAKLKVTGSGLRPMLRATIGDTQAMGFVFENPNSADVMVGPVPPGTHDLILHDGVQEVARAAQAVTIEPTSPAHVRIVGTFVGLDEDTAKSLQPGAAFPPGADPQIRIVHVGAIHPDRRRLRVGTSQVQIPIEGYWAREAVVTVRCDPDPNAEGCAVGGRPLASVAPPLVTVSGATTALKLAVAEVLPAVPPHTATARVRFTGVREPLALLHAGHRDATLDERAATIVEAGLLQVVGGVAWVDATLRLGADADGSGWSYRGQSLRIGSSLTFSTEQYVVSGPVLALQVRGADNDETR